MTPAVTIKSFDALQYELAHARGFLRSANADSKLQVKCAAVCVDKAIMAMPELGNYDKLSDTQQRAVQFLIEHMAETKADASQCFTPEVFSRFIVSYVAAKEKGGEQ